MTSRPSFRRRASLPVLATLTAVIIAACGSSGGATSSTTATSSQSTSTPSMALPAGALPAGDPNEFGVVVAESPDGVPTLAIWEDFQCPACGWVESMNGAGIQKQATSGQVRLIWRPASFLDSRFPGDHSARATAAWGCALDAGAGPAYHDALFFTQPADEGTGWTDAQLADLGTQVGITGSAYADFTACIADGRYRPWAAASNIAFYASDAGGTPTAVLDGVTVPESASVLADPQLLDALIAKGSV